MRVFAVSDIHLDYEENYRWFFQLSSADFQSDILILAGDISDDLARVEWCFNNLQSKFKEVFFVPGNHDLWVRGHQNITSIEKFNLLIRIAAENHVCMSTQHFGNFSIVSLLGWYDYSFGQPCKRLLEVWADFYACDWPNNMCVEDVSRHFLALNRPKLHVQNEVVISFSHFVPRIDLMPNSMPQHLRYIYPVLGSSALDRQIRSIQAERHLHIYGHSHLNRRISLENIEYINNAFGYPSESNITRKQLLQIY